MSGRPVFKEGRKLDVGIAEIDGQFREIQSQLERLRHASIKQYSYATCAILGDLSIQMRITFAVQESLMRLLSFPDTEAHISEHRQFLDQLETFRKRSQNFDLADGVSGDMQGWLIDHVQNFDRKFVEHFLGRSVNPAPSNDRPLSAKSESAC